MNPPFSLKSWGNGLEHEYDRFEFGRPPEKNGDYAFLLHVLKSLKSTGKAAVIMRMAFCSVAMPRPPSVRPAAPGLRQGRDWPASQPLLRHRHPGLHRGAGQENAVGRTGVFMIDASKGFMKDGPKNRLRSQDIHKIVDVFTNQIEVKRYSRMVPLAEIADTKNDYNLNIPRYIDSSEPEDLQDLSAHLRGGIPDRDLDLLAGYWDAFPLLRGQLFKPARPGYSDMTPDVSQVQQVILDSPEFQKFAAAARDLTGEWFAAHRDRLASINADTKPGGIDSAISEDFLARFKSVPLLDEYDVYEQLMTYWNDVMHDDVFLIMNDGWLDAAKPRKAIEDKDRKLTEEPDLVIGSGRGATKYKMDLVPPAVIVARYFAEENSKLDALTAATEDASRALEEYIEENATEDSPLAEAMDEGKVSKSLASGPLKDAIREGSDPEEVAVLRHLLKLYSTEAEAKKTAKEAKAALDMATLRQYGKLTEADVKFLVLDDKWNATTTSRIASVITSLTFGLVDRLKELGDRYAETVEALISDFTTYEAAVAADLAEMGFNDRA